MNSDWFRPCAKVRGDWYFRLGTTGLLTVAIVFLVGTACPPKKPPTPPPTAQTPPFIRGYIAAQVGGNRDASLVSARFPVRDIFLPDIHVFFINLIDKSKSAPVRTDLAGRFTLFAKEGRYRICWEAKGFLSDCSKDIYSVSNAPINVGTIRIPVDRVAGTTVVFGAVRLADGSRPRVLQPMANINAFAQVALLDRRGKTLGGAYVNDFGDYLLPQVPVKQDLTLRAQMEGGHTDQLVRTEANLAGAAFHSINLAIANHPPRLDALVATDAGGRRVFDAAPGDTVALAARASDADGDALKFSWLVSEGSGSLDSTTAPQVKWKLPNQEGLFSVTLIAYDGNGGYAQSPLVIRADHKGIPFSGSVASTLGGPVPAAEIEINGKKTTTNGDSFFHMYVKDADRFVFNIRKPGFALLSQIYERGIIGGQWTLHRATVVSANPTLVISGTDQRRPDNCPGPGTARLDWKEYPQSAEPQWQDGKGNVISSYGKKLEVPLPAAGRYNKEKGCGPGISVNIPANALQDENGNAPVGNVDVALSTVDLLSPDQMPGDYTVQVTGGTQVMQSYGAGSVEITAGGHRYNLKPGTEAQVTIPVDQSQLAAGGPLPPTIPILFYDEGGGVWRPEGSANLVGNAYVAKVKHFTEINTDTLKVNQSCVDIQSPGLPADYRLEITIPLGGGAAPKLIDRDITNSPVTEHVAYNLPSGINIVLAPYDPATKIPFGTFVVNTGGPQNPLLPNKPDGPPYDDNCGTKVILSQQALPQDPLFGEFLHGLFSFAATNLDALNPANPADVALKQALDQASANYYAQVDPRGKRQTLGGVNTGFKFTNRLDGTETRVFYANSGDLGFGRDMHCKKQVASDGLDDVACYVTNYGDITTPDDNDAVDAVNNNNPVATVAMEFSRIENPPGDPNEFTDPTRVVKFYVYNGNLDSSTLLRAANLDGKGARPVPQLCMVCHGGNYPGGPTTGAPGFNNANDVKLGSIFLPFDLHNYTFPPPPNDKANVAVQTAFQTLNQSIVGATNPGAAITDIIANMYSAGIPQKEDFVVTGWNSSPIKQTMYKTVVANACRTCHTANPVLDLRFTDDSQLIATATSPARLGSAENRVCTQHVMPHSKRTHDLFWTSISPHFPAEFQIFGDTFKTVSNGWQGNQCGVFTGGSTAPPSPLYADAKGIFNGICTGCHVGGSPPGSIDFSGDPYANLFNVNACEPSGFTMKRVATGGGAGALSNSYLVHKINGTQGGLGTCNIAACGPTFGQTGCGAQMPLNGTLSGPDAAKITTWVNAGAPH
jgi:hypothetical protein